MDYIDTQYTRLSEIELKYFCLTVPGFKDIEYVKHRLNYNQPEINIIQEIPIQEIPIEENIDDNHYSNGKIYKIEAQNGMTGDIYIGSTTKCLNRRMTLHKAHYNQFKIQNKGGNIKAFTIFDKYGFDNCKIILIENVNAKSKHELLEREAYYITNTPCINKVIPLRTYKQWYRDNRQYTLEKMKQYNNIHKDEIKIYQKEYQKIYRNKHKNKIKSI